MKKNNNGFVLIIFIFLFPLIIASLALIVDLGIMTNAKIKLDNVTRTCLDDVVNVEKIFKTNNINVISYEFYGNENNRCLKVSTKEKTIFARIVGYNSFDINSNICIKE